MWAHDIVVSADLVPGPGGIPRLAPVGHGDAKARVVKLELPRCRLLICGSHTPAVHVVGMTVGASVTELESLVWGAAAVTDRNQVTATASSAKDAFESHDYELAKGRYRALLGLARPQDCELILEAHLRLAAVAVHQGRPSEAQRCFDNAEGVALANTLSDQYVCERLASIAGMRIDAFDPGGARVVLQSPQAEHALDVRGRSWDRMQMLGSWRRLHLLEGNPGEAERLQAELLRIAPGHERPRALLDLGWSQVRSGDLGGARLALSTARAELHKQAAVYQLQSRAYLAWYVGRLLLRGGSIEGLTDMIAVDAINALLAESDLQRAGRWRLRALRAAVVRSVADLDALLTPEPDGETTNFQRWQIGAFLLEVDWARDVAGAALSSANVDLSRIPELENAVGRLREGWDADAAAAVTARGVY